MVGGQEDPFSEADTNQNGVLERSEFQNYLKSLSDAIGPFLFTPQGDEDEGGGAATFGSKRTKANAGFWSGFVSGIVTIWATEIGDKTFFIAAILSMRHDRLVVFAGAIGALVGKKPRPDLATRYIPHRWCRQWHPLQFPHRTNQFLSTPL